ncbi:MAG: hypothetical protein JNL01_11320 [Bdellovibrionales bacterium]|nr:hypothetical protein [Bdellovibrionales bacterium]
MRYLAGVLTGLVMQVLGLGVVQAQNRATGAEKSHSKPQNRSPARVDQLKSRIIPLGSLETERAVHRQGSCPDCGIPKRK